MKDNAHFIYQIRDPWPISLFFAGLIKKKSFIYKFFEKINIFLIKKSKFIISTLPNLNKFYKTKYKYKNSIYYLPNGCDVDDINKKIKGKKISFKKKITKIIYAGGFSPSHQVINFFKAIKNIQQTYKNVNLEFTFIGNGLELNHCKKYVIKNKLKNIIFLKTRMKSKIYSLLINYQLGICTIKKNKNEIFGYNLNKLYDYFACGLPIILTNNYYKNRFIEKNKLGYNCSINSNDISKKIIKYHDLSLNKKLFFSKNVKKFSQNNYNVKKLAKDLANILKSEMK
jgi:glycosyltransferase involved in cell wall biosynthesis